MSEKPKCSACNERNAFAKGLCSRCYSRQWAAAKKAERAQRIAAELAPKQLTGGVTEGELAPITVDGEIVQEQAATEELPPVPEVHLVARNPAEMQAANASLKQWLEQKLTQVEREVADMNAALNEAKQHNWSTAALTYARNKAVDSETYYFKLLQAVEAGYTIIPDFPVDLFAIRTMGKLKARRDSRYGSFPTVQNERSDCAPAGAGSYASPEPEVSRWTYQDKHADGSSRTVYVNDPWGFKEVTFPLAAARPVVMNATAEAMALKVFDQLGICLPVANSAKGREVRHQPSTRAARAGDPLIVGQVLRKNEGGRQRCVSFIVAWHLNLEDL